MWKFYDAFTQRSEGYQPQQGPMPLKRWIADGKRHKLHYRAPKRPKVTPTTDSQFERKAADYARWLAKRDGIVLPNTYNVSVIWSGVNAKRSTGRTFWDKRIRAVKFGDVTIDLPNWDFIPESLAESEPLQEAA
jgi:hypothetical protein